MYPFAKQQTTTQQKTKANEEIATMARRLGEEYDEYGLEDPEEERLIELATGGGGGRRGRRHLGQSSTPTGPSSSSGMCRLITVLFLLALAGVYHLGLQEGKNEVKREGDAEDVEIKKKEPWHKKILPPKLGGGGGTPAPTPSPTPPAGSFTLEHIKATRDEANKVIDLLDEYYFGKDKARKMLMEPWLDSWDFEATPDQAEKHDRASKLVDTMARALVTDEQTTFLMGGIGSSVMAGHDNCHYDR